MDEGASQAFRRRRDLRPNLPARPLTMAIALPMNVAVGASRTRARYMPHRVLPGFGLTLGFTVLYLGLFVLIPLSTIFVKAAGLGWDGFWTTVTAQRVMAAYRLSFLSAFYAALANTMFGFLVAWVLVRYSFPATAVGRAKGRSTIAIAGIAFTTLYAQN